MVASSMYKMLPGTAKKKKERRRRKKMWSNRWGNSGSEMSILNHP